MDASGFFQAWRDNAARRGVAPDVVAEIARRHAITPDTFRALGKTAEIKDPDGKSFFLLPRGISGSDAREAARSTYVLNAGSGYGPKGAWRTDFPAAPYCAGEITRITLRQKHNSWSYSRDVRFVDRNGGRLVATPNGILMGLGGNWIQRQFCLRGGTTWGDIFMVNMGAVTDPAGWLRRIIESGHAWYVDAHGRPTESGLDLDRVLHHEERHCRQWAAKGYAGMLRDYGRELVREYAFGAINRLEEDAGLADGGYKASIPW
jgi:hypothetical protein